MTIRDFYRPLNIGIFFYAIALLCGRVSLDRVLPWEHVTNTALATPFLFAAFILAMPSLFRKWNGFTLKNLSHNPCSWLAILVLLSGVLTPALTGRGNVDQLKDFSLLFSFILFPLLMVRDRENIMVIALCIASLCLCLPAALLIKVGDLGTESITPLLSDFSFYRLMIFGTCASFVAAFLAPARLTKILFFALALLFMIFSLYTDNKAVTLAIFGASFITCIVAISIRHSRFAVMIVLYIFVALSLSYTLNPSAKIDRWISTISPGYLMERQLLRSEMAGHDELADTYRHILADAKRIESAMDGSTYVYMNDTSGRLRLWGSAFDEAKQYPLIGRGYGDFSVDIRGYYRTGVTNYFHPHNILIEFLLCAGFVGFVLVVILIMLSFVMIVRMAVSSIDTNHKSICMVTLWTIMTFLIGNMSNGDVYDTRLIWVLAPLFITALQSPTKKLIS